MKNNNIIESFKNAFSGFTNTFLYERNFRFHIFAAVCAIVLSVALKIDVLSFAAVILAICTVLTAELINTAVEAMVDLYCGEKLSPYAKLAKDAAAAAVLLSAVFAIVIGVIVFGEKIINLLFAAS